MFLKSLYVKDFRNYREASISFSRGKNLIYGKNGRGKTNLIEAVYLLSTSKSFRHASDRKITRWGCEGYIVRGVLETQNGTHTLALQYNDSKKTFSVNGIQEQKLGSIIGYLYCVLFSFEDISLITGPPVMRRSFLDLILSTTDSLYFAYLKQYVQLTRQKNGYLKGTTHIDPDMVDVWNRQLITCGTYILYRRIELVRHINSCIHSCAPRLTHFDEPPQLRFRSNCIDTIHSSDAHFTIDEIAALYEKVLYAGMKAEIEGRQAIVGPHRDDFGFYDSRHSVRHFGSTGEARLASILLKLAQVSFYTDVKNVKPVLLVDDILPELDPENKKSVLSLFGNENQIFITAIEQSQLPEIFSGDRVFHIYESGTIQ